MKTMTKKDRDLLLKDLCARLPYGVRVDIPRDYPNNPQIMERIDKDCNIIINSMLEYSTFEYKPYLRPLSSMTEEEAFEMFRTVFHQCSLIGVDIESDRFRFKMADSDGHFAGYTILFFDKIYSLEQSDWLLSHHFDYRGLIPMGLALESPEGIFL